MWNKLPKIRLTLEPLFSILLLIGLLSSLLSFSPPVQAASNSFITFQGKIVVKTSGINVIAGSPTCIVAGADTCDIRYSIYDAASGGTLLWQETWNDVELGDTAGVVSAQLNSICNTWTAPTSPCAGSGVTWGSNPNLYLQIDFDTDGNGDFVTPETFARKLITSTPYAYYADNAGSLGGISSGSFVQFATGNTQTSSNTNQLIDLVTTGAIPNGSALFKLNENGANTPDFMQLQTAGTNVFEVTNSGNLGIATGANGPLANLHVTGTSAAIAGTGTVSSSSTTVTGVGTSFTTQLHVGDAITASAQTRTITAIASATSLTTDTAFSPVISAGTSFTFQQPVTEFATSSGTNKFVVTAVGNVGINTSAPTVQFQVVGGVTAAGGVINLNAGSNNAVNIATAASTGTVTIGGTTAAQILNFGASATTGAKTINIGSVNVSTGATNIFSGSGGINIGTGASTGAVTIGGGSNTIAVNATNWSVNTSGFGSFGTTTSTAFINAAASTTSNASLRLLSSAGISPTLPNSGDLWWTGSNLYFNTGTATVDVLNGGNIWVRNAPSLYPAVSTDNLLLGTTSNTWSSKLVSNGDVEIGQGINSLENLRFSGTVDSYIYFDTNYDTRIYDNSGDRSLNIETGSGGGPIYLNPTSYDCVGINTQNNCNAALKIRTSLIAGTGNRGLIIQASAAGDTADLFQTQTNTSGILDTIDPKGRLTIMNGGLATGQLAVGGDPGTIFGPSDGTISSSGTTVTGVGTNFFNTMYKGYVIDVSGQQRIVTSVNSSTSLTIDSPFSPNLSAGTTSFYIYRPTVNFGDFAFMTYRSYQNSSISFGTVNSTANVNIAPSTTTQAAINLVSGVDPTTPLNGDFWWNGTNLNFRTASATVDLLNPTGPGGYGFVNFTPTSAQLATNGNSLINITQANSSSNSLININNTSGSTANFVNLQQSGTSVFAVDNNGTTTVGGNIQNLSNTTFKPSQKGIVSTGTGPKAIAVSGTYAYVVNSGNTLQIFDVTTPTAPTLLSSILTGTTPVAVALSGNYAYVLNSGSNTMQVYDVSRPSSPTSVGTVTTGTTPSAMSISGGYIYIVNSGASTSQFQIFDIGIPSSPVLVGSGNPSGTGWSSINVYGKYAYMYSSTSQNIVVFDITKPTAPVSVYSIFTGTNPPLSLYASGRYLYTFGNNAARFYDISSSSYPQLGYQPTAIYAAGVVVSGRYAYLIDNIVKRFQVWDVYDPTNSVNVSSQFLTDTPNAIAVSGRYAYIIDASNSLRIFDLTGTETTSLTAHSAFAGSLQVQNDTQIQGQLQVGSGLTVGAGGILANGGLDVTGNIQNLSNTKFGPQQVGAVSLGGGKPYGAAISGRFGYYPTTAGAKIVDLTNPASPVVVGTMNSIDLRNITIAGKYAYVATNLSSGRFYIYDISSPASPTLVYTSNTGGYDNMIVSGNYLYVANQSLGAIQIYDVTNPASPVLLSTTSPIGSFSLLGKYIFAVSGTNFYVYDVSNPVSPVSVTTFTMPTAGDRIVTEGRYAYITSGFALNLKIIDVSNPASPSVVSTTAVSGINSIADLQVSGRYVFVCTGGISGSSINVYDINNASSPSLVAQSPYESGSWGRIGINGRYLVTGNYSTNTADVYDLSGIETTSLIANSAEVGSLSVRTDIITQGSLQVATGLNVGSSGITSIGQISGANGLRISNGNVGFGVNTANSRLSLQGSPASAGTGTISSSGQNVTGSGTVFTSQVHVGDVIVASGQTRTVLSVASDTLFTTDIAFNPVLPASTSFTIQQPLSAMYMSSGLPKFMVNALGYAGIGTTANSTTALQLPAGNPTMSSLNISSGAAPTSPNNGDLWATSTSLFYRNNGTTVDLINGSGGNGFVQFTPSSTQSAANSNSLINLTQSNSSANPLITVNNTSSSTASFLRLQQSGSTRDEIFSDGSMSITPLSPTATANAFSVTSSTSTAAITTRGANLNISSTASSGVLEGLRSVATFSGAGAGAITAIYGNAQSNGSAGNNSNVIGIQGTATTTSPVSTTTQNLTAVYGGDVANSGAGTLNNAYDFYANNVYNNSTGTINSAYNYFAGGGVSTTAGGNIANLFGYYVSQPGAGSGTITNDTGVYVTSLSRGTNNNYGVYVNTPNGGSGTNAGLYITGAGFTQNAEVLNLYSGNFIQTITGAVASIRPNQFIAPTITAATAQTVTNAATVYINAAPTATGSALITNSYAIWTAAGANRFDGNTQIGTTTGTARLNVGAATVATSAFRFVSSAGVDPTTPNNGDFWWNGTNLDFKTATATIDLLNNACSTCFVNGGNSFGGAATLGTNDSNTLALETAGTAKLTIDTSGNIGITTAPVSTQTVRISRASTATSGTSYPFFAINQVNLAANSTADFYGAEGRVITNSGAFTSGKQVGVAGTVYNSLTGTIPEISAFRSSLQQLGAAATVTNAYNLYIDSTVTSGGFIGSNYGIFVNNQTPATTNNYGIYLSGVSGGVGTNANLYIQPANFTQNTENLNIYSGGFTQTIGNAIANIRPNQFIAPTITSATAQTVTNAATLYINTAPQASGSATITNSYAIWSAGGMNRFDGQALITPSNSTLITDTNTGWNSLLDVKGSAVNNGVNTGIYSSFQSSPSSGSVQSSGGNFVGFLSSSTSNNTIIGLRATGETLGGSGTQNVLYGVAGYAVDASGSVTQLSAAGLFGQTQVGVTGATLTSAYSIYAESNSLTGGSTITNNYGLYVNNQTVGSTNNYGIYLHGASGGNGVLGNANLYIDPSNFSQNTENLNIYSGGFTQTISANMNNIRVNQFIAPTITAVSAQTVTNAATVYISAAPATSGSAIITNSYALWSAGGSNRFDGSVIAGSDILALNAPTSSSVSDTITTIASTNDVGQYSRIIIGNDRLPVMAYYDATAGDIYVTKCGNADCSSGNTTTNIDSTNVVGQYISMALGSDGLPVIAYYDATGGDLRVAKCGNAACSSGNTITSIDTTNNVGQYTSIAIGSNGFPIIAYYDVTNTDLRIASCGNLACTSGNTFTGVTSANNQGQYTSIYVPVDGLPLISYYDATGGDLIVRKCAINTCTTAAATNSVDTTNNVGQYSSITVGIDGLPIMSEYDVTNGDLRVVHCGAIACNVGNTATTIDSLNNVGQYTTIDISVDGMPIISEYDVTNSDLRVLKCLNIACTPGINVGIKDNANTVGSHNSMAIGADGLPVFSYYDSLGTNLNLKFARCATIDCSSTTGQAVTAGSNIGSRSNYFNNVYAANYYGKSFSISNFDLAEQYFVDDLNISAGDVVKFKADSADKLTIEKTNKMADPDVIGVISSDPGLYLKDWHNNQPNGRPVALSGRVPVKVNGENGPIKRGDFLTTSSTQGYATKAVASGMVIGRAMEDFPGTNANAMGMVQMFMGVGYMDSGVLAERTLNVTPTAVTVTPTNTVTVTPTATTTPTVSDTVTPTATPSDTPSVTPTDSTTPTATPTSTVTTTPTATDTATPTPTPTDDQTQLILSTVQTNALSLQKILTAFEGISAKRYASLSGEDLILQISGIGKSFKVLTQSDETLFAIDANGKIFIKSGANSSLGSVVIPAGQTQVTVTNSGITAASQFTLTPNEFILARIKSTTPGVDFTIEIEKPLAKDVIIQYLIIN